ncbi:hypothetical protein QBC47DRAFT_386921 [Echria macrotheca]|uniref:MYND-type domain-containing protein n=1 Tax=Echria macrotheca TaxID=438768 RepID=A0AAJ0B8Z1_9PEZI|nr:hypothetical protein QBC47DRAFT_386921 [Echria macrotheca]
MAHEIEEALKRHGVRPELCKVGVCTAKEREILEEARELLFSCLARVERDAVEPGDLTKCHGCRRKRECFFVPLKRCGRCKEVTYHSVKCQTKHWKKHKRTCRPPAATPDLAAHEYYMNKAFSDPKARALIDSLRIDAQQNSHGTGLPVHRLVATGQDTPENMRLLFGPRYEQDLGKYHLETRITYLFNAPPGSPSYAVKTSLHDHALVRAPRPATESEKKIMAEVREMQTLIRRTVGAGKIPSPADRQAILDNIYGREYSDKGHIYTLALSNMDQGVPTGGFRRV